MVTPLPHVHVEYLSRMGRRRSQSVTLPNRGRQENVRVQSIRRVKLT